MLLFIDRIIQKLKRLYRKSVFCKKINCQHKEFNLVGNVDVINTNIKLGKNVTIYPNVMFWGDGPIVIGDNVDIGCGCVLNPGTVIGRKTRVYPLNSLRGVFAEGCIVKSQDRVVELV